MADRIHEWEVVGRRSPLVHRVLPRDGERETLYWLLHCSLHDIPEQALNKAPGRCFSYGSLIWLRESSVPYTPAPSLTSVGPIYVGKEPVILENETISGITRAIAANATYVRDQHCTVEAPVKLE